MEAERGLCDDSIKIITDAAWFTDASLRGQLKEREGGREGEIEGMMIYWKLLEEGSERLIMREFFSHVFSLLCRFALIVWVEPRIRTSVPELQHKCCA